MRSTFHGVLVSLTVVVALSGAATAQAGVIPYDQVVLDTNPIAYWRLESNGSDSGTGGYNGTVNGTSNFVAGPSLPGITGNQSGNFNTGGGTITSVSVPDDDVFSFGNSTSDSPFTVSAWINPASLTDSFNGLVSKDNGTQREWALIVLSNGNLRMFLKSLSGNNQQSIDSTESISTSVWTHVAATYDGSGSYTGINLFINGTAATLQNPFNNTYTAMSNTSADVAIGVYGTNFFEGLIDEVAIFNGVLSLDQISALAGEAQFTPAPEPSTLLLLSLAATGLAMRRRAARRG